MRATSATFGAGSHAGAIGQRPSASDARMLETSRASVLSLYAPAFARPAGATGQPGCIPAGMPPPASGIAEASPGAQVVVAPKSVAPDGIGAPPAGTGPIEPPPMRFIT